MVIVPDQDKTLMSGTSDLLWDCAKNLIVTLMTTLIEPLKEPFKGSHRVHGPYTRVFVLQYSRRQGFGSPQVLLIQALHSGFRARGHEVSGFLGSCLSSAGYSGAFNAADKSGFCACVGEPGRTHEAMAGQGCKA